MNYQTWVLERLIGKYENSKLSVGGESRQKVAVRIQREKAVADRLDSAEEKEQFLEALKQLKENGLIDYAWVRYETGNLIERVWLMIEDEKIRECYQRLGRTPKPDVREALEAMIQRYAQQMKSREDLHEFFLNMLRALTEKHSIPRFFSDDLKQDEEILRGLVYLADNEEEIQERVFSTRLYGDSKVFEKRIKGKILSVLRFVVPDGEEKPADEELLSERGVVKWPEILEFTGDVQITLNNGRRIDYEGQEYGSYTNSLMVMEIKEISLERISRVMFIENKANYVWYLAHEKKADELVLYHGGCYSPVKGIWFHKIYAASQKKEKPIAFFHWSDIDAGGFRIFARLQRCIVPELLPYRMDRQTLEEFRKKGIPLEKESYRELLRKMKDDSHYEMFWEVIQDILRLDIRLEQENLL